MDEFGYLVEEMTLLRGTLSALDKQLMQLQKSHVQCANNPSINHDVLEKYNVMICQLKKDKEIFERIISRTKNQLNEMANAIN
jgi:endo-1,4-beta-D-glucanase Y